MSTPLNAAEGRDIVAARRLVPTLAGDGPIDRKLINRILSDSYGGLDADGRWTQRESFEVLELALAIHLRTPPCRIEGVNDVRRAVALADRLPTQTVRSEDQLNWQQFSTPVDLAALAVLLAQPHAADVVLEPSAGNGLLIAHLPPVAALQLNEIDPNRRARLVEAFPEATITGVDGATIGSSLAAVDRPSLILMNPPFSRSLGRGADDLAAVRHLQAAIGWLRRGGRLVAIMPDWFAPGGRLRALFETMLAGCTIRTSIRLRRAYAKHGTSVAVRLLVLDKIPGASVPCTIPRYVTSVTRR